LGFADGERLGVMDSSDLTEVYLTEYKLLKEEQRSRITVRDNLIYATFTSVAAVVFFAFGSSSPHVVALLLLPPVCLVFGWTYLANDTKITEIGNYLRMELSPKIYTSSYVTVLGWESFHRSVKNRRKVKFIQMSMDLLVFCVVGWAAALIYSILVPHTSIFLMIICSVEALAMALFAYEIIGHYRASCSAV
jgi:hypothetical protein